MSRATSPPAAPAPLCTITVGLCASAKKHQQSFDALREAGKLHNERVLQLRTLSAAAAKAVTHDAPQPLGDCASATSNSRSHRASRGLLDNITAHSGRSRATAADSPSRSVVNSCLFRFVNLNYDAVRHRIVVCVNPDIKGEHPAGASPSGVVPGGSGSNAAVTGSGGGGSKPKASRTSRDDEPGGAEDSANDAGEASQASLGDEVDVVFHKVATFGTASAIRALERWCKLAQKRRSRHRKPPLVVVDPLEKVQLLMTRSMLYKLLDNTGEGGQPVALIPRTFMWESPGASASASGGARRRGDRRGGAGDAATPLGIHSFSVMGEEETSEPRANGTAAGRWWIAKPDEGTGPAFTHHLVMWRTRNTADVTVPAAVQAALPTESRRFIVQELYVYALPVVLKVYCVGPHIYVKVNPTVNLLTHLWEHTRGSTVVDVPVMMDSQDKGFFSTVASTTTTPSRPNLSAATSGADYGHPAGEAAGAAPLSPNPMTAPATPPQDTPLGAAADHHQQPPSIAWEAMMAPGERWDSFLAPGTPAYTAISKLAQDLSGYAGIGLSLYGFDVVLVPQYLAHAYQRKGTRGIGRTEGATVRYDVAPTTPAKLADTPLSVDTRGRTLTGTGGGPAPNAVPLPFHGSDMFDSATGAPTALLLDSIPVVIDVNYFPGYKGVAEAGQHMLELIALRTTHAQSSGAGAGASGTRHADAKKWRCTVA